MSADISHLLIEAVETSPFGGSILTRTFRFCPYPIFVRVLALGCAPPARRQDDMGSSLSRGRPLRRDCIARLPAYDRRSRSRPKG